MAYCGPRGIPLTTFLGWPQEDQDAALQWAAREAQRCPGCGTYDDDWVDAGGDAYHSEQWYCAGCSRIAAAEPKDRKPGVTVRLARGPHHSCPRCSPTD